MNLNLDRIKPGDTVTTVRTESGRLKIMGLWTVGEWSDKHNGFRLNSERGSLVGILSADGGGYYAMHSRKNGPHYWYSANPDHIRAARKRRKASDARAAKVAKESADKLAVLSPLLDSVLLDSGDRMEYIDPEELLKLPMSLLRSLVNHLT
jgi:hypothetical protein